MKTASKVMAILAIVAVFGFAGVAQASSYGVDFNGTYTGETQPSGTVVWPDPAGALGPGAANQPNWNHVKFGWSCNSYQVFQTPPPPGVKVWTIKDNNIANPIDLTATYGWGYAGQGGTPGDDGGPSGIAPSNIVGLYSGTINKKDYYITLTTSVAPFGAAAWDLYVYYGGGTEFVQGTNYTKTAMSPGALLNFSVGSIGYSIAGISLVGPPNGDLVIKKYNDVNGDGSIAGDPLLPGWTFTVEGKGMYTTGVDGTVTVADLAPGDYTVVDLLPEGWTCTYDTDGAPFGTVLATVVGGQSVTVEFGNTTGAGAVPEPAGLGLIGAALLALRKRRS